MIIKWLPATIAKGLGTCTLTAGLLWQIAEHAGTQTSEVAVHVPERPAIVAIDGTVYPVATWRDSPIACELLAGWHDLRMWRGDRLVYQETFGAQAGENVALTAWDPCSR
jgi:hypothetical protein